MIETAPDTERAILVGLIRGSQDERQAKEYLDELEFLTDTAGAVVLKKFTQKLEIPNTATFVGSGKLEEIGNYVKMTEADTVIFDDELSPISFSIFLQNARKQHMQKRRLNWHNINTCCRD